MYNRYLAGATFMGRQGLIPAKGKKGEVLTGSFGHSKWRLRFKDFTIIGTSALKAAKRMGLNQYDRDLRAFIVVADQRALDEGRARPPVAVPRFAMRTDFLGDHPFDHKLKPKCIGVPRRYHNRIRPSGGLIDGEWPIGIEPAQPAPKKPQAKKTIETPSTAWLWSKEN